MAKDTVIHTLPEGRVINQALFEKDTYVDPVTGKAGKPSYKIEVAFNPNEVLGEGTADAPTLEDLLYEAAEEKWGEGAGDSFLNGEMRSPLLDGNKLADRREKKGKPGDAYRGKIVVRAHTLFNKHGEDAPGGVQVWAEDLSDMPVANSGEVYAGVYGEIAVTIGTYVAKDHQGDEINALMFYLAAFHKTNDGERLMTPRDTSTLFKPVGRKKGDTKRTRKG